MVLDYPQYPAKWMNETSDFNGFTNKDWFGEWTYEACESFVELVEKAVAFDKANNEPNCQDPEKVKLLGKLLSRVQEIGLKQAPAAGKCLELSNRIVKLQENLV